MFQLLIVVVIRETKAAYHMSPIGKHAYISTAQQVIDIQYNLKLSRLKYKWSIKM